MISLVLHRPSQLILHSVAIFGEAFRNSLQAMKQEEKKCIVALFR